MAGLKHDDERNPEAGLDLRDSPGDEPVRTVEDRSTDESFVPESARSEEAPRVQGLDLRDSPGDEPVRSHGDPSDRITSGDGEVAGVAGGGYSPRSAMRNCRARARIASSTAIWVVAATAPPRVASATCSARASSAGSDTCTVAR